MSDAPEEDIPKIDLRKMGLHPARCHFGPVVLVDEETFEKIKTDHLTPPCSKE